MRLCPGGYFLIGLGRDFPGNILSLGTVQDAPFVVFVLQVTFNP
jgi:hypothetical protein